MEGKINSFFDEKNDVLEITVGQPRKAVAKEQKNDIAVRCGPETGEIVGIYTEFSEAIQDEEKTRKIDPQLNIPITTNFQLLWCNGQDSSFGLLTD